MTENIKAYAKINLHLDVLRKREDGYHDVNTVMQSISLCDDVSVTLTDDKTFSSECNVPGVPCDEKNIAVRAAALFASEVSSDKGAYIKIEKRIPMAAGLAGGSTDAAATLVAMNKLHGEVLSTEALCELGSKLGADVPFCVAGGCKFSNERGDKLYDFPSLPKNMIFVVACGGEGVSTPWAYSTLDKEYNDFVGYQYKSIEPLLKAVITENVEMIAKTTFNVFEAPISSQRPAVDEIKNEMIRNGAINAMMSGSGPSVFGIFRNLDDAKRAELAITEKGYFASVCYPT